MISEKINKTAEKETISNCKEAEGPLARRGQKGLSADSRIRTIIPLFFLLPLRHSVRKLDKKKKKSTILARDTI